MKVLALFISLILGGNFLFAQATDSIKPLSLMIQGGIFDFGKKALDNSKDMPLGLSAIKGLGKRTDLVMSMNASYIRYPYAKQPLPDTEKFYLETDASINLKACSDLQLLTPFLGVGMGAYTQNASFGLFLPVKAGLQIKLVKSTFMIATAQYRLPLTSTVTPHLFYGLAFGGSLWPNKLSRARHLKNLTPGNNNFEASEAENTPVKPGGELNADIDGDGIPDNHDRCPETPGLLRYGGCPIPDADEDGINDEVDKCPTVKGISKYAGCPVPDSDHDGIEDDRDQCPFTAGSFSNQGCPLPIQAVQLQLNQYARFIFFETGKANLLDSSKASLAHIANTLRDYPHITISIEGHTDDVGSAIQNQILSEQRAREVRQYLLNAGIDANRLQAVGFGESMPVADNNTADGRKENRRVVLKVIP